jgi:sugar phosphate permease
MMGIFGIMRGMAGTNYTLVLFSTFGIAAAQPFLLNTWTKVPANWFALEERATAVGMVTLASLVGTALGMVLTPILMESLPINTIQLYYGGIAAVSAILFIALSRETPPTPPCPPGMEVRALMLDGLKHALTVKVFWFGLAITFVGLGIFNGVTTWVENIIRPRGFTPTEAGTLGALMIVGGVIGAVVIPAMSDKYHKRQLFLFVSFIGAIPGLIGLTFAMTTTMLYISAFVLGFFLTSAMPVLMQYTAEVTHPTPEGTSNGLVQLFGQASVVFVFLMQAMKNPNGSFTPSLLFATGLLLLSLLFIAQMKDPLELTQIK